MQDDQDARLEKILKEGPSGTWAVAGLATFIVFLIYFLFYFLVYIPRGATQ